MKYNMFYQKKSFINELINICKITNNISNKIYNNYLLDNVDTKYIYCQTPLDKANLTVNKYICEKLNEINNKIKKDILIVSKNGRYIPFEKRKKHEWIWLVDSIYCEEEFIKKSGKFTTNIGLVHKGIPVFGIVGLPSENLIYYGCRNIGSFKLNTKNRNITKIEISKLNLYEERLIIVLPNNQEDSLSKCSFIKYINYPKIDYLENSEGMLLVVENKADIFLTKNKTIEWNVCAFHAVLKYANGMMKDYDYGADLIYNKKYLVNPSFVCSGNFIES